MAFEITSILPDIRNTFFMRVFVVEFRVPRCQKLKN